MRHESSWIGVHSVSRMERRDVRCTACNMPVTIFAWLVIDVAQYPDLKRQLLQGHMNVAPCPACSRACSLDVPVLYRDPGLGFAVQYVPAQHRLHPSFLRMCTPEGQLVAPSTADDRDERSNALRSPHIVFAMEEMRNYVAFRDRISIFGRPGVR